MVKKLQTNGRRKKAVVRLRIEDGTGLFYINNLPCDKYVKDEVLFLKIREPFIISNMENKYNIKVSVFGGGMSSQVEAIRQSIARALSNKNEKIKKLFQLYDKTLLVSDTRQKETYKPNNSKARAKRQKSYR